MPRDPTSNLPDEILHHIFSFDVDTKQLVKTSVLTKRWRKLWYRTHTISFNGENLYAREDFTDIVNRVFAKLSSESDTIRKIDKFSITANSSITCPMDDWVSFVVSTLGTSELDLTAFCLQDTSRLGNEKTLRLNHVYIPFTDTGLVLSLENVKSLTIIGGSCSNREKIKIDAPLLEYLIFDCPPTDYCEGRELSVLAPNLSSLEYRGCLFKDFDVILTRICNVKSLTLSAEVFQFFAALPEGMKSVCSLFQNLKYLKLTNWRNNGHIVALRRSLLYFPFIETLVLERTQIPSFTYKVTDWESQLSPSSRSKFNHLKTMEVQNIDVVQYDDPNKFKDSNEFKFIEFMMKHAPNLHKVIIRVTGKITLPKEILLVRYCRELQKKAYPSVTIVLMLGREIILTKKGTEAFVKIESGTSRKRKRGTVN